MPKSGSMSFTQSSEEGEDSEGRTRDIAYSAELSASGLSRYGRGGEGEDGDEESFSRQIRYDADDGSIAAFEGDGEAEGAEAEEEDFTRVIHYTQ